MLPPDLCLAISACVPGCEYYFFSCNFCGPIHSRKGMTDAGILIYLWTSVHAFPHVFCITILFSTTCFWRWMVLYFCNDEWPQELQACVSSSFLLANSFLFLRNCFYLEYVYVMIKFADSVSTYPLIIPRMASTVDIEQALKIHDINRCYNCTPQEL